jgi:hypothetical protein
MDDENDNKNNGDGVIIIVWGMQTGKCPFQSQQPCLHTYYPTTTNHVIYDPIPALQQDP